MRGPADVWLTYCVCVKRINISTIECPEKYKLFELFIFNFYFVQYATLTVSTYIILNCSKTKLLHRTQASV